MATITLLVENYIYKCKAYVHIMREISDFNNFQLLQYQNGERSQYQSRGGLVMAPLADFYNAGRWNSGFYSSQTSNNVIIDDGQV